MNEEEYDERLDEIDPCDAIRFFYDINSNIDLLEEFRSNSLKTIVAKQVIAYLNKKRR